jgi:hypothetical protein
VIINIDPTKDWPFTGLNGKCIFVSFKQCWFEAAIDLSDVEQCRSGKSRRIVQVFLEAAVRQPSNTSSCKAMRDQRAARI